MKNNNDFNKKWSKYLENGHYGLVINNQEVIDYLDKEFEKEVKQNPNFTYSQIKLKFGYSRVYASTDKIFEWEDEIDNILNSPSFK